MAVPKNPLESFLWGAGGAALTPDEIARRREMEQALVAKTGIDTSPVGHWTQGLARVLGAAGGAYRRNRLDRQQGDVDDYNSTIVQSLIGGASPAAGGAGSTMPMAGASGEITATGPVQPIDMTGNEVFSSFIDTAKAGGLTNPYGLAALAATGKAESGFDPGNVNRTWSDPSESGQAGTAGGILSWRGPRYQALAATGDLSPAGQAKFFLQEDPALVAALNNAKSTEEAIGLMNNAWKFAGYDRPGGEAARRLAAAQGFLPSFQGGGEVAALTPEAAIDAVSPVGGSLADEVAEFEQTPAYAAQFPGGTQQNQQQPIGQMDTVAQALTTGRQNTTAINPEILRALADPRANAQTRGIAELLLRQQLSEQEQQRERQARDQDPLRQLQIRKAQMELDSANRPDRQPLINAGNGNVYDPNSGEWIQAPGAGEEKTPDSVRALELRAERAGLKPGTPEYNQFMITGGSGGTSLSVGPNGEVSFSQGGAAVKPLTEAQSKDAVYATRATNALPLLNKYEDALLSLGENVADGVPLNLGRYAQSEEYQVARDAGRDFLATILRKDTGAAITQQEEDIYGKMFLPQPGDKPAAIQAKKQRRALAVEAIKAGMPTNAIENMAKALESVPTSSEIEIQTDIPGVKIRRKN